MDLNKLLSDLKQAEGVRFTAYKDSRGFWTGGVGHLLDQSKDWTNVVFTQVQVDTWLKQDVYGAQQEASELLEWPALDTDARQNAYVELIFNMGESHWESFSHTRHAVLQKNWQLAHDQLLDSAWAGEVGSHRAQRLANYLLTGEFDGRNT